MSKSQSLRNQGFGSEDLKAYRTVCLFIGRNPFVIRASVLRDPLPTVWNYWLFGAVYGNLVFSTGDRASFRRSFLSRKRRIPCQRAMLRLYGNLPPFLAVSKVSVRMQPHLARRPRRQLARLSLRPPGERSREQIHYRTPPEAVSTGFHRTRQNPAHTRGAFAPDRPFITLAALKAPMRPARTEIRPPRYGCRDSRSACLR